MELAPVEPENLPPKKVAKLAFCKTFESARVIFLNYQYEYSYTHILTKLLSLVPVLPEGLALLIVGLPPGASFCDSLLADTFQRNMGVQYPSSTAALVMFIRYEDK